MPFQNGNKLGGRRKEKQFHDALQMELKETNDGKALRKIARKLIAQAEAGEPWAIKEIADRLDGKPTQAIDQTITDERLTDGERLSRIAELLERAGAVGIVGVAGAGKSGNGSAKPH